MIDYTFYFTRWRIPRGSCVEARRSGLLHIGRSLEEQESHIYVCGTIEWSALDGKRKYWLYMYLMIYEALDSSREIYYQIHISPNKSIFIYLAVLVISATVETNLNLFSHPYFHIDVNNNASYLEFTRTLLTIPPAWLAHSASKR